MQQIEQQLAVAPHEGLVQNQQLLTLKPLQDPQFEFTFDSEEVPMSPGSKQE